MKVTKIEAAKRELEQSIRFVLSDGDPVVSHLIAYSSKQILQDLCKQKNIRHLMDTVLSNIKPEKRGYITSILKKPYNFFHHADKDPNGSIEFNPEYTELIIWESIQAYHDLTNEITGIMQSYRGWFYLKNEEFLTTQEEKQAFLDASKTLDYHDKKSFIQMGDRLELKRLGIK